jgi:hypothetical protein
MDDPLFVFSCLTSGFPKPTGELVQSWIGPRLVWWSTPVPARPWLSVVSSRLGRPWFRRTQWFAHLRAACQLAQAHGDTLVFADNTATARFLERCGYLYQLPTLRLVVARERMSLETWLRNRFADHFPATGPARQHIAFVSPPLDVRDDQIPTRDALTVAVADRIMALQVRPGGHTERLLTRREAADGLKPVAVRAPAETAARPPSPRPVHDNVAVMRPDQVPADWLLHWTRQHDGPWPDEPAARYLDGLIMGDPTSDHSALATLRRIVAQRRLLASTRAIRGGFPVVCFTATPLALLSSRRVFRPHRRRWDFEPFGLCIDAAWLKSIGTRPVIYGDDQLWNRLSCDQRPFFQKRNAGRSHRIDWSAEHEWRHLGNVDLVGLPSDAAILFVPTMFDACQLTEISPWPIAVLDEEDGPPLGE